MSPPACSVSIIIPTLNEAATIVDTLLPLQPLRRAGSHEIIVADGGSTDATPDLTRPYADKVIMAPRGRAKQMNAGAKQAEGEILLFLHADTQLPLASPVDLELQLQKHNKVWGHFQAHLSGSSPWLRIIGIMMNYRSRCTAIATGDQAIFVRKDCFDAAGGYPDIPLMEDIALSKRLKQISRPLALPDHVITSSRRWEQQGIAKTVLLMWRLRLAYFFGADPTVLARIYYPSRRDSN